MSFVLLLYFLLEVSISHCFWTNPSSVVSNILAGRILRSLRTTSCHWKPKRYQASLNQLIEDNDMMSHFTTATDMPPATAILNSEKRQKEQSLPIWDPVQQIYINGIVPQQKCIQEMIAANNGTIRIFGYGSLCWNPGKPGESALADIRVTRQLGKAIGYRRAWAQKSTDHRGTPSFPGVVCTLLTDEEFYKYRQPLQFDNQHSSIDKSEQTQKSMTEGVLFEVPPELVDECLQELDFREKGGYARDTINVIVDETGDDVQALLYRGTPDNPAFWPRALTDLPFTAATIATAVGPSGDNHVYLDQLESFLNTATNSISLHSKSLQYADDTFLLNKMAKALRRNNNLHFFIGCGSNQHNQLLWKNKNDNSNELHNHEEKLVMTESVLCVTKATTNDGMDLITNIYAGGGHSAALSTNKDLFLFGWNDNGQLGSSGMDEALVAPLPVIKSLPGIKVSKVALGFTHTIVVEHETDMLYAFGSNSRGQSDPTLISSNHNIFRPAQPRAFQNDRFVDIAAGVFHSAGITVDGVVVVFGCSRFGECFTSSSNSKATIGRWKPSDGSRPVRVVCGRRHTAVLDDLGRIWTNGENKYGQLGRDIGTLSFDPVPGLVRIEEKVIDIRSGWSHIVALVQGDEKGHPTAYGWGRNDKGQLGTDTVSIIQQPCKVFSSFTNVHMVDCGSESTVIMNNDGEIYTCGWNEHGNLGTGNTIDSFHLQKVSGSPLTATLPYLNTKHAVCVAAGGSHLIAMKVCMPD